jgi:hypothetical protein
MPCAEAKGLFPGRGIPDLAMPWLEEKGLFPGRGIPVAEGFGALGSATGSVGAAGGASGAATGSAEGAAGAATGAATGLAGAAGFSSLATGTTPSSAKAALSFLATGGSTVEDGPLTNSPISFSFSSVRFESMPNSAAISCTRGFPATILLSGHTQAGGAVTYKRGSFRATHKDSISHSACS